MAEKSLIGELDMYREAGIKPNFSDMAKRYGKDGHTVAAHWRAEGGRPRDGRADRAGSFDAHIEEVAAKAQLPGVTKKGIHEWLLHRYPGEDPAGYNAFTQFMRKNGIAVGASVGPEPHPRFETPPGLQPRFDWKESVGMANRDGELFEFDVFAATLGHSRRHIFIRSGTRTTDDLVRCMYATIARLGGAPREWVTDNMSALVAVKGGRRLKVQRAYEFAKAAGFELKLCRPRGPQTKGRVESSDRLLSRLAAYQGDFDGWDDIDEIIARIEDASNSEPNETTGLPPSALFMEEKDALLPVGNLRALEEAMGDVVRVARVPATMLVGARGEPMSVPGRCIGGPARIVCMPGGAMDCYVGGGLVATHVAGGPAYDPARYAVDVQ
ncbi:IS21 family transposase [Collinsella stercoris]|uniref:IS21 family transposase n=1 Tax=Collinsella stercoris TaxID=147206 RepID=UPI0039954367